MFDLRPTTVAALRPLIEAHHGYGSVGNFQAYAFGVFEEGRLVAGYTWQPPPPQSARTVCPDLPQGVLALSRMVACGR